MPLRIPPLGILQGRLTPSPDGSIQFFPKDNWQNEFAAARDIGFDCIELLVKQDSWPTNPLLEPGGVEAMGRLTGATGVFIGSVHGFYERSEKYPLILRNIIRKSSTLGAKTVLVSFFNQNTLNNTGNRDPARLALGKLLQCCQEESVRIGIETEMPATELLDFIRFFNHPNIGIYYDIGNMASLGVNVAKEIRLLSDKICGIHIKDRLANCGKTVPLGEGCADFETAFGALRDIGYTGPFIIQGARVAGVDDVELNRQYYRFCKNLLEKIYGGGGQ